MARPMCSPRPARTTRRPWPELQAALVPFVPTGRGVGVLVQPYAVELHEQLLLRPDLAVIVSPLPEVPGRSFPYCPDLVIEVTDDTTRMFDRRLQAPQLRGCGAAGVLDRGPRHADD